MQPREGGQGTHFLAHIPLSVPKSLPHCLPCHRGGAPIRVPYVGSTWTKERRHFYPLQSTPNNLSKGHGHLTGLHAEAFITFAETNQEGAACSNSRNIWTRLDFLSLVLAVSSTVLGLKALWKFSYMLKSSILYTFFVYNAKLKGIFVNHLFSCIGSF